MEKIVDHLLCTGCSACMSQCPRDAITMTSGRKGFLYPQIDPEKCVDCGRCQKACPVLHSEKLFRQEPPAAFAAQHYVEGILKNSSSGGVFTAVSDYVLRRGGVVYGAVYATDMTVTHIRAENTAQRNLMRDSKYVQSDLKNIFRQVQQDLDMGRMVLFTGTPCQCAGLRSVMSKEDSNLILMEIFCHSVPSPRLFRDHIAALAAKNGSAVVGYSCRDKRYGWTRRDRVVFANGKVDDSSALSQSFYKLFNLKVAARDSCGNCPFGGKQRCADISIGDFWGYREVNIPQRYKGKGLSVVLANSRVGKQLLNEIPGLQLTHIPYESVFIRNHSKPIVFAKETDAFWAEYERNGYLHALRSFAGYTAAGRIKHAMVQCYRKLRSRG